MSNHSREWAKIQTAWVHQRIPQSLLFVGPQHSLLDQFAIRMAKLCFCQTKKEEPCLTCSDCMMVDRGEHPDLEWVKPDKIGGSIKIDSIRDIQQTAFLTPKRATYRLFVIENADRMNNASANALLKILEEPPQHTLFILVAEQLSTLLPTVLSRCQLYLFSSEETMGEANLLSLGEKYLAESERAQIIQQSATILSELIDFLEHREQACNLAVRWAKFEMNTLFWFLYLVFAQLQMMSIDTQMAFGGPADQQLKKLFTLLNPVLIFKQIDKINKILRKISHNINMNYTLTIEDLLLAFGERQ